LFYLRTSSFYFQAIKALEGQWWELPCRCALPALSLEHLFGAVPLHTSAAAYPARKVGSKIALL